MRRYLWGSLRASGWRTLALLLGILVATASFTVLTGTAATSRLSTVGTVRANYRAAYDILVRPRGSTTPLEANQGLVRNNYLSGIFGGITMAQYRAVRSLPGVTVAAPIAMIGYVLQTVPVPVPVPDAGRAAPRQLFRIRVTRTTDRGLTRLRDADSYVYVTPRPLQVGPGFVLGNSNTFSTESLPTGQEAPVCPRNLQPAAASPFDTSVRSQLFCWSRVSGLEGDGGVPLTNLTAQRPGATVDWPFPMLIAAIDPAEEAALASVDSAVVSGRYLRASDAPVEQQRGGRRVLRIPVLVSTRAYQDESAAVSVESLPSRAAAGVPSITTAARFSRFLQGQHGTVVKTATVTAEDAYSRLLQQLRAYVPARDYWTSGATRYAELGPRTVAAQAVTNPPSVWQSVEFGGYVMAPLAAADTAFRPLVQHPGDRDYVSHPHPALGAVGEFDLNRLPGFNALSAVPLETYNPPVAAPGDARTRRLLHEAALLPNGNPAGYLAQPPLLLTTLASLPAFTDPQLFNDTDALTAAPISTIRVRVANVTGPDPLSRERVRLVAQQITQRTGLDVDVTIGSSPTPMTVDLPAGRYGRPPLTLREGWVKKGVAVAILKAVDRKSLLLFGLILAVCALFVANAAAAAVRSRRTELGVLACLGWRAGKLFTAVLAEVTLVGLAAGLLGGLLALPLAAAFGLTASVGRAALAVPAAAGLALLAGLDPAWRASRADPGAAVRPAVLTVRRARSPRGVLGLAVTNLTRVPGRSLLGALSLAVGVCALTLPSRSPSAGSSWVPCSGTRSRCRSAGWTTSPPR